VAVKPSIRSHELLLSWGRILSGRLPMLSIEITRECPLACPGCYAFGESHLGGGLMLRNLADKRGDDLIEGVIALVRKHKPLHVSLVGGEPLVRHRELSRILPVLSQMGVFTLVVTSAVIPIPAEWMSLRRVRIAVSVDGLPEHHDARRKPATYDRILKNIAGREVNIHWTITRPMLSRSGYLEEYVRFWNARTEVNRIWVSAYTPQTGERSAEMLSPDDRRMIAADLPALSVRYPKLVFSRGFADALLSPPQNPRDCLFAKMSANYSADLETQVEPCVFGGAPDCSQCGCAVSIGLHWIRGANVAGPITVDHFARTSIAIGNAVNRIRSRVPVSSRWQRHAPGGIEAVPKAASPGPAAGRSPVGSEPAAEFERFLPPADTPAGSAENPSQRGQKQDLVADNS
jgi:sulfatase maturation enzyme AslB (radical SAM superfamily)